jgi:hypothetical protein
LLKIKVNIELYQLNLDEKGLYRPLAGSNTLITVITLDLQTSGGGGERFKGFAAFYNSSFSERQKETYKKTSV